MFSGFSRFLKVKVFVKFNVNSTKAIIKWALGNRISLFTHHIQANVSVSPDRPSQAKPIAEEG